MSQEYTPVTWVDETSSVTGTVINAARLNQMQAAHHYADGWEEVDTVPTADPGVSYHKFVYCTADSAFYRWDGTQWTKDLDDDVKALLQQEVARATAREDAIEAAVDTLEDTTPRKLDWTTTFHVYTATTYTINHALAGIPSSVEVYADDNGEWRRIFVDVKATDSDIKLIFSGLPTYGTTLKVRALI